MDVLIRFWGQKVKVTAGNDPKPLWTPSQKTIRGTLF